MSTENEARQRGMDREKWLAEKVAGRTPDE